MPPFFRTALAPARILPLRQPAPHLMRRHDTRGQLHELMNEGLAQAITMQRGAKLLSRGKRGIWLKSILFRLVRPMLVFSTGLDLPPL